ncbi:MAG: metal-dependent transcriptional regulator [Candidatus Woesearchaeota archaeon]
MADLTESFEDYLEVIYILDKKSNQENKYIKHKNSRNKIRIKDIAKELNVKLPSVTEMVRKLSAKGFVEFEKYKPINLTQKGKDIAKKVYARHKSLKKLFMMIGVDENTASIDACKAEHILSKKTIKCINKFTSSKNKNVKGV